MSSLLVELWPLGPHSPLTKNLLAVLGGKLLFFGASFARNLFLARLVGPLDFGAWNLGLVYLQYAQWSHFSILNAFRLDGARSRGMGDIARLQRLRRLTWTACVAPALVVVGCAAGASLWVRDVGARNAALMLAALLLPYQLYAFANSCLGTEERFVIAGQMQAVYAVLNMGLTLGLAILWRFWGALLAQIVSYGLILFFYRRHFSLWPTPLWDWPLIREQFKLGLPIGLNGVVYSLFITLDRTLIAWALGVAALGQYGLTALARSSIGLIPDAISEVIYMRVSTQYGQTRSVDTVLPMILRTDLYLAYLTAPVIGLGIIWIPWAVQLALPAYVLGVAAVQVFLIGLFFTFPVYAGVLLTSIGRAADLLLIYGAVTGFQAVLCLYWIRPLGITGVALATAGSSGLLFLAINAWGLRYAGLSLRRIAAHILLCLLPWVWMLVGLAGGWLASDYLTASARGLLRPFMMSLIFLGSNLPLLWLQIRGHLQTSPISGVRV